EILYLFVLSPFSSREPVPASRSISRQEVGAPQVLGPPEALDDRAQLLAFGDRERDAADPDDLPRRGNDLTPGISGADREAGYDLDGKRSTAPGEIDLGAEPGMRRGSTQFKTELARDAPRIRDAGQDIDVGDVAHAPAMQS